MASKWTGSVVAWDAKGALGNYEYVINVLGVDDKDIDLYVFRHPRTKQVWAYAVCVKVSWRHINEGHVRLAIRDGWVPDKLTLEQLRGIDEHA